MFCFLKRKKSSPHSQVLFIWNCFTNRSNCKVFFFCFKISVNPIYYYYYHSLCDFSSVVVAATIKCTYLFYSHLIVKIGACPLNIFSPHYHTLTLCISRTISCCLLLCRVLSLHFYNSCWRKKIRSASHKHLSF